MELYWTSRDGTRTSIKELQDNHLFYALRKIMQKNSSVKYGPKVWSKMDTQFYNAMSRELTARGFDKPIRLDEKWNEMIARVSMDEINRQLTPEQEKWIEDQFTF